MTGAASVGEGKEPRELWYHCCMILRLEGSAPSAHARLLQHTPVSERDPTPPSRPSKRKGRLSRCCSALKETRPYTYNGYPSWHRRWEEIEPRLRGLLAQRMLRIIAYGVLWLSSLEVIGVIPPVQGHHEALREVVVCF